MFAGNYSFLGTPSKFGPHVWVRLQRLPVDPESGGRVHPLASGGRADVPQRFHGIFPGTGMCCPTGNSCTFFVTVSR